MQTDTTTSVKHARHSAAGSWVVLIAAAAFAVASLLPFAKILDAGQTTSLYRQFVVYGASNLAQQIGASFFLFGGALTAGIVSIIGLRLRDRTWVAPALAAAVASWSLTFVGALLNFVGQTGWALLIGYWCVLASLALAVFGAIIALRSG